MVDKVSQHTDPFDFYLASSSPRRRELLLQIASRFQILHPHINETHQSGELPLAYVQRMAREKAEIALTLRAESKPVLAADTTVLHDGQVMGKPQNFIELSRMLTLLSGSTHLVVTSVCLTDGHKELVRDVSTEVRFRDIQEEEIQRYWASGEPADKAGGYGIQGLGAIFVAEIKGSYSNVVGLPLTETADLLTAFDIGFWFIEE